MKVFTNLLFKFTLSSMVLTAPAMIPGDTHAGGSLPPKEAALPFYSSAVIKKYIDHPVIVPVLAYPPAAGHSRSIAALSAPAVLTTPVTATYSVKAAYMKKSVLASPVNRAMPAEGADGADRMFTTAAVKAAEVRRVIYESAVMYSKMDLQKAGLSEMAFEYAWRGYHNLLKKGSIRRKSILSICDFSQSSHVKRMYVIDVRHRKLLYQTYVAHGQNSGDEFAQSFSNEPESFKSSLGFYVTQTAYYGHNGLSLRLNGVDSGYNDMALKRNIVLHGSTYVSDKYMQDFGNLGTSLGCPALPAGISSRIIRIVRNGSCLFIYHPTQEYLDHSTIIND